MARKSINKWQFGDFQTPDALAEEVVSVLKDRHSIEPDVIIEPTCGKGAFVRAALQNFKESTVIGADINSEYVQQAKASTANYPNSSNAVIQQLDFFNTDWHSIVSKQSGYILVIGNPPWVTSSELSALNSNNFPSKSNFQRRRGIDAITGSGNFDISEWMLLQHVDWLRKKEGAIALLCKYSVARKVIRQVECRDRGSFSSYIYLVDAKAHFGASVEACLFILCSSEHSTGCPVYSGLNAREPAQVIGERDGFVLSDTVKYEKWKHLLGKELRYIWRSGIKHDCSKVMELKKSGDLFENGFGRSYALEENYLYPLLKSSDVGNSRVERCRKFALITQNFVGEDTTIIKDDAPETWKYLQEYTELLENRKSSIYKNRPPYSVFGIGAYTFKPWKVAISGLYKRLNFQLVSPLHEKAVVFDDTVNFLSFDTEEEARFIFSLVISEPSLALLDAMIFWDEKRPITISILRRLSFKAIAKELGLLDTYLSWATMMQMSPNGQFELGLAEKQSKYTV